MSKFTPAPWRVIVGEADEKGMSPMKIKGSMLIATMPGLASDPEIDSEIWANIRLITAGPDLYSTLLNAGKIVRQHNLLSTATDEERNETIERLIRWWNEEALPMLVRVEGRG